MDPGRGNKSSDIHGARHILALRLSVKKELIADVHSFRVNEAFQESWKFVDAF
jgi:hypothetical protein